MRCDAQDVDYQCYTSKSTNVKKLPVFSTVNTLPSSDSDRLSTSCYISRVAVDMDFNIHIHIHIHRSYVDIHGYIHIHRCLSCIMYPLNIP